MSVHDLHPGVLRVVIEKADLDEKALQEQAGNRGHRPIPFIAIIGRLYPCASCPEVDSGMFEF
jgi:hypothetical protein